MRNRIAGQSIHDPMDMVKQAFARPGVTKPGLLQQVGRMRYRRPDRVVPVTPAMICGQRAGRSMRRLVRGAWMWLDM